MNCIEFHRCLCNNTIMITNLKLNKVIQDYSFIYITKDFEDDQKRIINQNMQRSNVIMIDKQVNRDKNCFYLISFSKTLIIIDQSKIINFQNLITNNSKIPIYILPKAKSVLSVFSSIQNQYYIADKQLFNEISTFNSKVFIKPIQKTLYSQIWNIISSV